MCERDEAHGEGEGGRARIVLEKEAEGRPDGKNRLLRGEIKGSNVEER